MDPFTTPTTDDMSGLMPLHSLAACDPYLFDVSASWSMNFAEVAAYDEPTPAPYNEPLNVDAEADGAAGDLSVDQWATDGAPDSHLHSLLVTPPSTPSLTHNANTGAQPQSTLPNAHWTLDTQGSPPHSPSPSSPPSSSSSLLSPSGTNDYAHVQAPAPCSSLTIAPLAYPDVATSPFSCVPANHVPPALTPPPPVSLQRKPTSVRKLGTRHQVKQLLQPILSDISEGKYSDFDGNGMLTSVARKRLVRAIRKRLFSALKTYAHLSMEDGTREKDQDEDACRQRVKYALQAFNYGNRYSTGAIPVGGHVIGITFVAYKIALAVAGYTL